MSQWWYVVVSALTLGITITNWMVGILATIVNHRPKQSVLITLKAFCLVAVLVVVQKVIFPIFYAGFLNITTILGEGKSTGILLAEAGGPAEVIKCFIFDTVVIPGINIVDNLKFPAWSRMSIQLSSPGSGSLWGTVAVFLWIALLSLGLWGFFSIREHLQLRVVLGITLVGQLTLHILYGDETFLHSLHFLPFLIVLAALSTLTRARLFALLLAGILVLSAGLNNGWQFRQAIAFSQGRGPLCALPSVKCGVTSKIIPNPDSVKPNKVLSSQ